MKTLNRTLLLMVLLLSAPFIGQSQNNCTDNLLPNPDFETSPAAFNGWSINLGTVLVSDDAANGDNAALLTGYAQAQLSETLPAEAGKRYTFRAMAKMEGDALIEGQIRIKFMTSNYQTLGFANATRLKLGNDYEEYSVRDIAPANTAFVQVAIYKRFGDGFLRADD